MTPVFLKAIANPRPVSWLQVAEARQKIVFALGLAAIVILAAALRLPYFNWGLPYVEYPDETHLYWKGQSARGLYDPDYLGIYPPAIIWMEVVTQQIQESRGQPGLTATVSALRLLAAIANTAGTAIIGVAAYMLAGSLAGWFAAGAWAVSGYAVEHALYAIPEPFIYPLIALCLLLAAGALLRPERWRWAIWSLLVVAAILLFEYRLFVLALPGGLILARRFLRGRHFPARRWLLIAVALLAAGVLAITAAFYLLPSYRTWLVRILFFDLWNMNDLYAHVVDALRGIGGEPALVALLLMLGLAALIVAVRLRQSHPQLLALVVYGGMFFLICWVVSAVRWQGDMVRSKNVLMASVAGCVLLGAAVAQVARLLPGNITKAVFAVPVAAFLFLPVYQATTTMVNSSFSGVSWHVVIRQWFDTNLTPGTVIVYREHEGTFNPFWGGIPHRHWTDWWPTGDVMEYSLAEWRDRGMSYAVVPIPQHRDLEQNEAGRAYLANMLRLRDFVHPPTRRGAEAIFYRLWRMDVETDIHFEDAINLIGYDRSAEAVRLGDTLMLNFYWKAVQTPADNYSLFIHLVPSDEYTPLSQADGAPAVPERPTLSWDEPSETLISPPFNLSIPSDIPSGEYRVMIGLYNFQTGQRLPVSDAAGNALGDALPLMTLRVES